MKRIHFLASCFFFGSLLDALAFDPAQFQEFKAEPDFIKFLDAMPIQMETGGAKILRLADRSLWLVSIGTTVVNPATPTELMRRRTVAQAKAQANAVAELNGTHVTSRILFTNKSDLVTHNGRESGMSEELLDEIIVTEARGVIKNMPIVATWMDKARQVYFIAIAKKIK